MRQKAINELVFWFHFALIPLWIAFSVFGAPLLVIALTACHQLHLKIFNGCVFTRLQKNLGGFREGNSFFESLYIRIFRHIPSRRQLRTVDGFVWIFPLAVALLRVTL